MKILIMWKWKELMKILMKSNNENNENSSNEIWNINGNGNNENDSNEIMKSQWLLLVM